MIAGSGLSAAHNSCHFFSAAFFLVSAEVAEFTVDFIRTSLDDRHVGTCYERLALGDLSTKVYVTLLKSPCQSGAHMHSSEMWSYKKSPKSKLTKGFWSGRNWTRTQAKDHDKTPRFAAIDNSSAESGTRFGTKGRPIDPDLRAILNAWPGLPEAIRAEIRAIVRQNYQSPGQDFTDNGGHGD